MPSGIVQIGCCKIGRELEECLKCLQIPENSKKKNQNMNEVLNKYPGQME